MGQSPPRLWYLTYGFYYNNGYGNANAGALGYPNTFYIKTGAPPRNPTVVSFTGTPLSGAPPLAVQFNDTSTNSPISWNWSFGDGNTPIDRPLSLR
ncbi:PKD domain-containing protein [Methanoregula sp.]|uniref:PKD domain-containing protein n=1 Tax=Methanoregula sp. TaxID=2052170 RepID=UPI003569BC0B